MNPQSFNRYMYVNGNPLGDVDPSGLAGGLLGGIGNGACGKKLLDLQIPVGSGGYFINPCNPIMSGVAIGVAAAIKEFGWGGTASNAALETGAAAVLAAGLTIGCSINNDRTLCGPPGWASIFIGGDAGKAVDDSLAAVGATAGIWCLATVGANSLACGVALGYAIYAIANDVFAAIWAALGLDPPQFTGSLLPRPTDLGGLGTAPIGIPNQNLSLKGVMGHPAHSLIPSPGVQAP